MSQTFFLSHALLPTGVAADVAIVVADGGIAAVSAGAARRPDAIRVDGLALPGMPNLHSHAFQRGMAGLAERRGPEGDSFWTWREVMYRFLGRLSPDDVEAIAAFAFLEMLERGFTAVGEFHYLHHDPAGQPYADAAELAGRIVAAAGAAGIGLTLLPCLYAQGSVGGGPPMDGQRRFVNNPDRFARIVEGCRALAARRPGTVVGVAPHSLRAVTPDALVAAVSLAEGGPIHIHAAEQTAEVEACLAWSGRRPVEWLLDEAGAGEGWCLIHATHMTADETARLARSGAVAGLCPLTESSLGDGVFPGPDYLAAGGTFGVGTDSNIDIDAAAELRQLEYGQRLTRRGRNLMTTVPGESTGARLFAEALAGGARALGRPAGGLAPGAPADIVVLDLDHPAFAGGGPETWLDAWIFAAGREAVRTVIVGGDTVVSDGRHRDRDRIAARYREVLGALADL